MSLGKKIYNINSNEIAGIWLQGWQNYYILIHDKHQIDLGKQMQGILESNLS